MVVLRFALRFKPDNSESNHTETVTFGFQRLCRPELKYLTKYLKFLIIYLSADSTIPPMIVGAKRLRRG